MVATAGPGVRGAGAVDVGGGVVVGVAAVADGAADSERAVVVRGKRDCHHHAPAKPIRSKTVARRNFVFKGVRGINAPAGPDRVRGCSCKPVANQPKSDQLLFTSTIEPQRSQRAQGRILTRWLTRVVYLKGEPLVRRIYRAMYVLCAPCG